jgi:hypothetical protein
MRVSRKISLASSALALLFSAAANAQTVVIQGSSGGGRTIENFGDILNQGSIEVTTGGSSGIGASVSIGAAGAVASVGVSIVTGVPQTPPAIGAIVQEVNNLGVIVNRSTGLGLAGGSSLSDGASVSSSATGAAASFSLLGNNVKILDVQSLGLIDQLVTNQATVSNSTVSTLRGVALSGDGASVSFGATGAAASVSATLIEGKRNNAPHPALGLVTSQGLNQIAGNYRSVTNVLQSKVDVGDIAGTGASVSVAATGAAASASSVSLNGGSTQLSLSGRGVYQEANNDGAVINNPTNKKITAGGISGNGAAVQVSATGASASMGSSVVNSVARSNFNSRVALFDFGQFVNNAGPVSNKGTINSGDISGIGASTQVSAIGANAAVGASSIKGGTARVEIFGAGFPFQRAETLGDVRNAGKIDTGSLSGTGSSNQISAVGASTSLNVASIEGAGAFLIADQLTQTASNLARNVRNTGDISSGALIGTGSSVQIASIGASSSVAVSSLDGGDVGFNGIPGNNFSSIASNSADIINGGTAAKPNSITINGDLSGLASSASISAVGASTSFSLNSTDGGAISASGSSLINQDAVNFGGAAGGIGRVFNRGSISAGSLTGTGSSIQVAAVGASASVAVSSIASSTTNFGTFGLGTVSQLIVSNSSAVTNIGVISAGMVSGVGSGIGISATGASASVSLASIAGK